MPTSNTADGALACPLDGIAAALAAVSLLILVPLCPRSFHHVQPNAPFTIAWRSRLLLDRRHRRFRFQSRPRAFRRLDPAGLPIARRRALREAFPSLAPFAERIAVPGRVCFQHRE